MSRSAGHVSGSVDLVGLEDRSRPATLVRIDPSLLGCQHLFASSSSLLYARLLLVGRSAWTIVGRWFGGLLVVSLQPLPAYLSSRTLVGVDSRACSLPAPLCLSGA